MYREGGKRCFGKVCRLHHAIFQVKIYIGLNKSEFMTVTGKKGFYTKNPFVGL